MNEVATPGARRHEKYERLIAATRAIRPIPCAVAHPCDASSLRRRGRGGRGRHHRPDPGRPGAQDPGRGARRPASTSRRFELVDVPHSHAAAAKAVELVRAGRAELLMKGSLHTDELMREVVAKETGPAHRAADQPRLHHGRAELPRAALHHRRRGQHLPRPRDQGRHRPERDRPAPRPGPRRAAGRHPLGGRDREPQDPVHASTPRPCARWPTAARSRAACSTGRWRSTTRSAPRRPRSRASARRWRAGRRSWSCPTSRPATCWPRT